MSDRVVRYLLAVVLLPLCGCDQPRQTVDAYLEKYTAGERQYYVKGVSDYTLVNHKILKSNEGIVTAELTFKNRRGGDIVETHNFRVGDDGKIVMLQ